MLHRFSRCIAITFLGWSACLSSACKGEEQAVPARGEAPEARSLPVDAVLPAPVAPEADKWNYPDVAWVDLDVGLQRMSQLGRPALLVVKAEWCSRCREYRALFSKAEFIKRSKAFEMILVDQEASPAAAARFPVGNYVPRTLFLTREGTVDETLVGPDAKFPHFFDAQTEALLLAAMDRAAQKAQ
jgi:protein-disulfide reductase (glutathione)